MDKKEFIEVYVDGCCLGNPGPGGWACIIKRNNKEIILTDGEPFTTNNQMELKAVISALSYFKEPCKIRIYTDSEYVLKGITQWLESWKKRGFRTSKGTPVKNRELWEKLDKLVSFHHVEFIKVPAHSGVFYNEKADRLAKESAEKWKKGF